MRPQTVTDEQILKIARKVFLENGPQASVEVIAKKLGLSQPALFKRFGTKRNLIIQAMQMPKNIAWFRTVEDGPDDRPFNDQLKEITENISRFLKTIQPVIQFISMTDISPIELMPKGEMPPPLKGLHKLTNWLEQCHKKGLIRKTDFQQAAMGIMGSIQFNAFAQAFAKSLNIPIDILDKEKNTDKMIDLFWNGLKKD